MSDLNTSNDDDLHHTAYDNSEDQHQVPDRCNLDVQQLHCNNFCLTHVHLIGNVVYHHGRLYTVCVKCAAITEVNRHRMHSMMCTKCHLKNEQLLVAKEQPLVIANFCASCRVKVTSDNAAQASVLIFQGNCLVSNVHFVSNPRTLSPRIERIIWSSPSVSRRVALLQNSESLPQAALHHWTN